MLPFIAGVVAGGLAVYAFKNKKHIKDSVCDKVGTALEIIKSEATKNMTTQKRGRKKGSSRAQKAKPVAQDIDI